MHAYTCVSVRVFLKRLLVQCSSAISVITFLHGLLTSQLRFVSLAGAIQTKVVLKCTMTTGNGPSCAPMNTGT